MNRGDIYTDPGKQFYARARIGYSLSHNVPELLKLEANYPIWDLNVFKAHRVPRCWNRAVVNPENSFFPDNPVFPLKFDRISIQSVKFSIFDILDPGNEFLGPKLVQLDTNFVKIG